MLDIFVLLRQSPLCLQTRNSSLFEILSFPAKTALTSIMYASYAALIYLVSWGNY